MSKKSSAPLHHIFRVGRGIAEKHNITSKSQIHKNRADKLVSNHSLSAFAFRVTVCIISYFFLLL